MRRKQHIVARRTPVSHRAGFLGAGALLVVFLLAACGAGSQRPTAHASPTPNERATAFAHVTQTVQAEQQGLVTVRLGAVSVKQQFDEATQRLLLEADARITVTNHTNLPIHLAGTCIMPFLLLSLGPADLSQRPLVFGPTSNCVLENPVDIGPAIAPGGSETYQAPNETSEFSAPSPWPAGQYILTATATGWHQGTLEQTSTPTSTLLGGTAQGQTLVTLT